MSGFFKGPPLLVHVFVVALVSAIIFPLLFNRLNSFFLALLVIGGFSLVYVILAVWWGSRDIGKKGKYPDP